MQSYEFGHMLVCQDMLTSIAADAITCGYSVTEMGKLHFLSIGNLCADISIGTDGHMDTYEIYTRTSELCADMIFHMAGHIEDMREKNARRMFGRDAARMSLEEFVQEETMLYDIAVRTVSHHDVFHHIGEYDSTCTWAGYFRTQMDIALTTIARRFPAHMGDGDALARDRDSYVRNLLQARAMLEKLLAHPHFFKCAQDLAESMIELESGRDYLHTDVRHTFALVREKMDDILEKISCLSTNARAHDSVRRRTMAEIFVMTNE